MCDNNKDIENQNEPEKQTGKDESSNGCLTWLFILWILSSIIAGIVWLIWMFQGRPDNWYGKLYRFQFKIFIFILICVIVYGAIGLVKRLKTRKKNEEDNKEEQ